MAGRKTSQLMGDEQGKSLELIKSQQVTAQTRLVVAIYGLEARARCCVVLAAIDYEVSALHGLETIRRLEFRVLLLGRGRRCRFHLGRIDIGRLVAD
jgi:hypothetical protein